MRLEVQLFAGAREAAGCRSIQIEIADKACAADVLNELARHVPALTDLIPACRLAIDQTYVTADATVSPNSEIALIPPVSGG